MRNARARQPSRKPSTMAKHHESSSTAGEAHRKSHRQEKAVLACLSAKRRHSATAPWLQGGSKEIGSCCSKRTVLVGLFIPYYLVSLGSNTLPDLLWQEHWWDLGSAGQFRAQFTIRQVKNFIRFQAIKGVYGGVHTFIEIVIASFLVVLSIDVRNHEESVDWKQSSGDAGAIPDSERERLIPVGIRTNYRSIEAGPQQRSV